MKLFHLIIKFYPMKFKYLIYIHFNIFNNNIYFNKNNNSYNNIYINNNIIITITIIIININIPYLYKNNYLNLK